MNFLNILVIIALVLSVLVGGGLVVYGLSRIASIAYFRTKQGFVRSIVREPLQGREDYDE